MYIPPKETVDGIFARVAEIFEERIGCAGLLKIIDTGQISIHSANLELWIDNDSPELYRRWDEVAVRLMILCFLKTKIDRYELDALLVWLVKKLENAEKIYNHEKFEPVELLLDKSLWYKVDTAFLLAISAILLAGENIKEYDSHDQSFFRDLAQIYQNVGYLRDHNKDEIWRSVVVHHHDDQQYMDYLDRGLGINEEPLDTNVWMRSRQMRVLSKMIFLTNPGSAS